MNKETIENIAYVIVCKMIDAGFIEDEPSGLLWEYEIQEIIEKHLQK